MSLADFFKRLHPARRHYAAARAAEAAGHAGERIKKCPAQWCDVLSSFFEVQGRLRLDDVALQETAAVQRGQGRHPPVTVLWRQRQPLTGLKED